MEISYTDEILRNFTDFFSEAGPEFNIIFSALMMFLLIFFIIMIGVIIISYVFEALGAFTIAKRRQLAAPWLAWIPVASSWLLGSIADDYDRKANNKDIRTRKFLLGFSAAIKALNAAYLTMCIAAGIIAAQTAIYGEYVDMNTIMIPFIILIIIFVVMYLLSAAYMVFYLLAIYRIYSSCVRSKTKKILLFVFSCSFSFIIPFVLFSLRKKDEGLTEITE